MKCNTIDQQPSVLEMACMARSIRGVSIPQKLIATVVKISKASPYNFNIGSAGSLSRSFNFFKEHKNEMTFYGEYGEEFEFDDGNTALANKIFMAVHINKILMEATVYMYFPYDGAYQ